MDGILRPIIRLGADEMEGRPAATATATATPAATCGKAGR
jgi:hypothetical protein